MKPGQYDLTIYQGADLDLPMTWQSDAEMVYDLSSHTARLQVRANKDSTTVLLEMTSQGGQIVLAAVSPNIKLVLTAAVTALITWTEGVYDLELVEPGGKVIRLLEGLARVSGEVTR